MMSTSRIENGQRRRAAGGSGGVGLRRGSLPAIPSRRQGSTASNVNIRYSSLPTSGSSPSEGESSGNETDETATTAEESTESVSLITRPYSQEQEGASVKFKNLMLPKQTSHELEFMTMVSSGNVFEAREFIRSLPEDKTVFDINSPNFDGYSALHIAVQRQDEEMVKLLLSIEGIDLCDTFFHAIKEGDVGLVKQFIDFELNRPKTKKSGEQPRLSLRNKMDRKELTMEALGRLQDLKKATSNSEFDEDITPLMLAAQCGHYELIKLFFDTGQRMPEIEYLDCKTDSCRSKGELNMSYARLHIYQAISNPAYISFIALEFHSVDPILEAFRLIGDLKEIANIEQEVKNEYEQLITDLQEFTGEILGLCRDDNEVKLLLQQRIGFEGNSREKYPRLILAVKIREKEFVTHPHTQKILIAEWIRGYEQWETMSTVSRALEFAWRTILLVIISLWQFIHSNCWSCGKDCSRKLSAPVSRFIHAVGSYAVFLVLLTLEVNLDLLGDPFDPNDKSPPRSSSLRIIIEISIFVFAVGHVVSTLKQYCFMPGMFFGELWNVYDLANHVLYIIAYGCFIAAFITAPPRNEIIHTKVGGREYWGSSHPLFIGESLFSCGIIMSFCRIFRVLQLHEIYGPLQIALGKMLKDMCRLIVPFLTVILAFAAGLCMLYKGYDSWVEKDEKGEIHQQGSGFTGIVSSAEQLFWGIHGMAGLDDLKIISVYRFHYDENGNHTSVNHHIMTETVGKIVYAAYHILTTIVVLNTIVSMLTNAAAKIFENTDKEYKMGRTQVWIFYGRDMKVPAPFNTFALIRSATFLRFIGIGGGGKKWKTGCNMDRCCYKDEVNPESDKRLRTAYSILIKDLLERYFHAKATITLGESAKMDQVNKVRETVGELRERFKVIFTDVTGTTPSRKVQAIFTASSAVSKFKKAASKKKMSAEEMLGELEPVER